MTLRVRTPRRHISTRTKRRYRAIREFFRRTLGTTSLGDTQAISIVTETNLKQSIADVQPQVNEVDSCQQIATDENNCTKYIKHTPVPRKRSKTKTCATIFEETETSSRPTSDPTEYKPSHRYRLSHRNSAVKHYASAHSINTNRKHTTAPHKMSTEQRRYKDPLNEDNSAPTYSITSSCSLVERLYHNQGPSPQGNSKRHDYLQLEGFENARSKKLKEQISRTPIGPERSRPQKRRSRKDTPNRLDRDFIEDIIKRQYSPVKFFGRRESEQSQFSAPVCRDQEFTIQECVVEGSQLCSCCYEGRERPPDTSHALSKRRSLCDTRFPKRTVPRHSHATRRIDSYDDTSLYDMIPVKEKSSPKSRRKFFQENMLQCQYNREVPPSPRTHRPRLNLKSQNYLEYDDGWGCEKSANVRSVPRQSARGLQQFHSDDRNIVPELELNQSYKFKQKSQKPISETPRRNSTHINNTQQPILENRTVYGALNHSEETDVSEKTDKTLCEIKDILQNFLEEIKNVKPSATQQCESSKKVETADKPANVISQENSSVKSGAAANVSHATAALEAAPGANAGTHCACGGTGFMPSFQNPCCYPVLPICPINCIQNGYTMPTPSMTCYGFANSTHQKDVTCPDSTIQEPPMMVSKNNSETDELIKEIYKFVSQSPIVGRRKLSESDNTKSDSEQRQLTSRSVGTRLSRHDAGVGATVMKCLSKSCEAISSRQSSDVYTGVTARSETMLDKLNLGTDVSESDISSASTIKEQKKKSKLKQVFSKLGLFKKKKKDTHVTNTDEESESSATAEPKSKSPYRQEIANYSVYRQDYHQMPPVPPYYFPAGGYGSVPREYRPPYQPRMSEYPPPPGPHAPRAEPAHPHHPAPSYAPYAPHRHGAHPHVPLCLKEIEVRSTATQSERKMSIFKRLTRTPVRSKPCVTNESQSSSTQTAPIEKPGLFSAWKNIQVKAAENKKETPFKSPMKSRGNQKLASFNQDHMDIQKKFAQGEAKMKKALIKKVFHKKNPFSPGNMLMKTILGRDDNALYDVNRLSMRPRLLL